MAFGWLWVAGKTRKHGTIDNCGFPRRRGVRRWRTRRILLRERSCCRGHRCPATATVQIMPAVADARAEEHADNRTKAAGSQLRSVHGGCLQWSRQIWAFPLLRPATITQITSLTAVRAGRYGTATARDHPLVTSTPMMRPLIMMVIVIIIMITVMTA